MRPRAYADGTHTGSDTGKRIKNYFSLFDVFLQFCDN